MVKYADIKMEYVYAALLLHKLGKPINEENVKGVISAAGAQPDEIKVKALVAALSEINIDDALKSSLLVQELQQLALFSHQPLLHNRQNKRKKKRRKRKRKKKHWRVLRPSLDKLLQVRMYTLSVLQAVIPSER